MEKIIQISWDYAKQLNDIHCRLYLQFFIVFLTLGITTSIAVFSVSIWFIVVSLLFLFFAFYYIVRIRSLPDDLNDDFRNIIGMIKELEKL